MAEELHDYARAQAWRPPAGLVFRIVGEPRVNAAAALVVDGELTNESAEPAEVIYFSGLHLRPLGEVLQPRPNPAPRPPPVPPPPMRIELAPGASHRFGASISLGDYTFTPGAVLELEWSFLYWTGDKPTGRVSIVLP